MAHGPLVIYIVINSNDLVWVYSIYIRSFSIAGPLKLINFHILWNLGNHRFNLVESH